MFMMPSCIQIQWVISYYLGITFIYDGIIKLIIIYEFMINIRACLK